MKQRREMEDKTTEEYKLKEISKEIRKHKTQQTMELIKNVIENNRSIKVLSNRKNINTEEQRHNNTKKGNCP